MSRHYPLLVVSPKIHPSVLVQPSACVLGDVEISPDSSVWYQTVIRGDVCYIRVGARTNIQDFCMVHVSSKGIPALIGDDVTLGHRVTVHACTVRDRVLVGMGAIIMDGAEIGEESIVGAGAVVTAGTVVAPGSMVLGCPARVRRETTPAERQQILTSARGYVALARAYREFSGGGESVSG